MIGTIEWNGLQSMARECNLLCTYLETQMPLERHRAFIICSSMLGRGHHYATSQLKLPESHHCHNPTERVLSFFT